MSAKGASFAHFRCATPKSTRQQNSSPVRIPCLRTTCETLTPVWSLSSAMGEEAPQGLPRRRRIVARRSG